MHPKSQLSPVRYLDSIWVAPTHRKPGVCRALIRFIAEMERQVGVTTLLLWCWSTTMTHTVPTKL